MIVGRLGVGGGTPNPCVHPVLVDGPFLKAFRDSDYGFIHDNASPSHLWPYVIDPTTLEVAYHPELEVTLPSRVDTIAILDDSTMVIVVDNPSGAHTVGLALLTRSGGVDVALGSTQQIVGIDATEGGTSSIARIDDTHFVRCYAPTTAPSPDGAVYDFCSVSGGVITIESSTTLPQPYTVDTVAVNASRLCEFAMHTDGSGLIVTYCFSGFADVHTNVLVHEFSIGGGISASHLIPFGFSDFFQLVAGKEGSSEAVFLMEGNGYLGFYWDGSAGHLAAPNSFFAGEFVTDMQDIHSESDYLNLNVGSGPGLVSQSGIVLSSTPITPVFHCDPADGYADGTTVGGVIQENRHGSNLAAAVFQVTLPDESSAEALKAFSF